MQKKGGIGGSKQWKKRWFSLTSDTLNYYAKRGGELKGSIALIEAFLVEASATKRDLCFQVVTPGRTYYLEPGSATERQDWVDVLRSCFGARSNSWQNIILRSGFLLKLGGKVSPLGLKFSASDAEKSKGQLRDSQKTKWQKRFFVLRKGELAYYARPKDIFPPEKRKGTILLRGALVIEESHVNVQHPNAFEIVSGDRSFCLEADEDEEKGILATSEDKAASKAEWVGSILLATPTAIFGVPLAVAVERSNPGGLVPAPVLMATSWLNDHALSAEGLYRIPGSKVEVEKFIRTYDSGSTVVVPDQYFAGNLASLVVQFFRRMPDDLFTEQYAPVFQKITEDYASRREPSKQLHMMKKLLTMLPAVNLMTLRVLAEHMRRVACHAEDNKMTPGKLAMCIYFRMAPTMQLCVERYEALFDGFLDRAAAGPLPQMEEEKDQEFESPMLSRNSLVDNTSSNGNSSNSNNSTRPPVIPEEEVPRGSVLTRVFDLVTTKCPRERSASLGRRSRSPSIDRSPPPHHIITSRDDFRLSTGESGRFYQDGRRRSAISRTNSALNAAESSKLRRDSTVLNTVAGFDTAASMAEQSSEGEDAVEDGGMFEKMTAAARRGWSKDFMGIKLPADLVYVPEEELEELSVAKQFGQAGEAGGEEEEPPESLVVQLEAPPLPPGPPPMDDSDFPVE